MSDLFDLSNFDKYKEDNCREVKKAEGGLPIALWESYSSFANSNGGVIILGVGERQDGTWYTTGLKNADKLKRNFWNTIHDTKKVSINLLCWTQQYVGQIACSLAPVIGAVIYLISSLE